ncbi:MAG: phosphate ABC transporter substrate-binding protein PstS [Deltaproteobacteria bacterium]|nr:phosphate ABC transporter substrate-binding protein PstS [Deltaproteobacteria bacterium]
MRTWMASSCLAALLVVSAVGCKSSSASSQQNLSILGAGATFPYPLYAKWGDAWHKSTGTKLNYQSIGSGGGIQQIKAKTVDFGASDAPLEPKELDAAGLVQFPMIMGGVVPVVHLEGVAAGSLVLDGETLGALYLGDIKRWDDSKLKVLNPSVALPAKDVTVVHRADGSGTTWIFTSYLSKAHAPWKDKVGTDKAVSWPVGVGGKGNEGVSVYVQRVDGAIGYVEYAYALQNKLSTVRLKNAAGKVVEPGRASFQAAAASADWKNAPGFHMVLTHQSGADAWPIVGASFILMYKEQKDAAKASELLRFFDYGYRKGAEAAASLDYVSMPEAVIDLVEKMWAESLRAEGKPVWPAAAR